MTGSTIKHDPALPWGWWMRTTIGRVGNVAIVDEDGREWHDLREALWAGRLGMSLHHPVVVEEGLELLLAMLAARSRGVLPPHTEIITDLFEGNGRLCHLWTYWLLSTGLISTTAVMRSPFDAQASDEGVSVLRMLVATRRPDLAAVPIGKEALARLGHPDTEDECDRDRFTTATAPSSTDR